MLTTNKFLRIFQGHFQRHVQLYKHWIYINSRFYSDACIRSISALVFYDIDFFEEFCRMSLNLDLSDVSSQLDLGMNFGWVYHRGVRSSQSIISRGAWRQFVSILVNVDLITWLRWCVPGFCTRFLFIINKCLVKRYFETMDISYPSSNFHHWF